MPDLSLELEFPQGQFVIGLDEAGRGPWAGPVVAAAVWLDPGRTPVALRTGLDDSKALSASARAALYDAVLDCAAGGVAALGIARASAEEIDAINILRASLAAMTRAAGRLAEAIGRTPDAALVDGPHAPRLPYPARPVVRGDSLSLSIAAASVLAKVTRDRVMTDLAERHPGYGWERNKGYGTPEHRAALAALGACAEHRRSFRPVRAMLDAVGIR